jgi:uncharacterized protein (TIGR00369 family)
VSLNDNGRVYLPISRKCYVCGDENPLGFNLRFYIEDGSVKSRFVIGPHRCGFESVAHGGVTATVLDECMSWAATRAVTRFCVTGELTVRYLRPVPSDIDLTVSAKATQSSRRLVHVEGRIRDDSGREYARAKGRFVPLSVKDTLTTADVLVYLGGEERLFDGLPREDASS